MTRQECMREILADYEKQRQENHRAQQERIAQAYRLDPEIARLREESAQLAFSTMRRILAGGGRELAEQMKRRGLEINREIRQRLQKIGMAENALEEQYRCSLCRDTGYVGDAPAKPCACLETEIHRRVMREMTEAGFSEQSFAAFDENFIPEENGQRKQLVSARNGCQKYIEHFPNSQHINILLTGGTGLGKTFLLNCIYTRALEKNIAALRVTGFRMLEAMRREHIGAENDGESPFRAMLETPLLFIDDLGTEPMMRNITIEYLFILLNERMAARRHTVIATNLSPKELEAHYGERVSSRLLDKNHCAIIQLVGRDLRTKR